MAAKLLYSTKDRDESHQQLEAILLAGEHPKAECREMDENGDYTVWSGPQREGNEGPLPGAPATAEDALAALDATQLGRLADMLAARMKGG